MWWIRFWLINENCHIFQMYSFAIIFDVCCALSMSNILNTYYLTGSDIFFTLKLESVSKITIFGLKMMVKSGLEQIFLKLVAHFWIFRLFMKGKFDAYVLWPLTKRVQNWIVDRSTARDFTIFIREHIYYVSYS